jgi:hypothetical protein
VRGRIGQHLEFLERRFVGWDSWAAHSCREAGYPKKGVLGERYWRWNPTDKENPHSSCFRREIELLYNGKFTPRASSKSDLVAGRNLLRVFNHILEKAA